ncbi:major facilitator superfamily transporter [Apiospora hydei]|uniref:Major facilitator superfamily transporter n=1 Tax=Apiospora hydei TaxID=1337664 RepID=A0ABR1WQS9_9PEZI
MRTQHVATTAAKPTETAPLLQGAQPSEPPTTLTRPDSDPGGWTKDAARTAVLSTVFLILYAFADVARYVAVVRLLELGICREQYLQDNGNADTLLGNGDFIPEHLCKSPEIQERLAHLRGYLSSLEAVVGLLLTLPYGLVVERWGERFIAGINVVGYMLSCAWLAVVCYYGTVFPIWVAVLSPLFRAIGGGTPTYTSVIYSMASKRVPAENRSLVFFLFTGGQIIATIVSILVTAWFLDRGLLFAPIFLSIPLGLLCLVALALIRPEAPAEVLSDCDSELDEDNVSSLRDTLRHSWSIATQLFKDRRVFVLLAAVPLAKLNTPMTELTLQYIPEKFDMSIASASRVLSVKAFESLVLMVVILPVIQKSHTTQYSFLIQTIGCFLMAFAQTFYLFILGLLLFSLGSCTRPALQSVITDLVSPQHVAVLYTVIAVADGVAAAAGALLLNRAFAMVIKWNVQLYLGFPFLIGAICCIVGFAGTVFVGHRVIAQPKSGVA